MIRTFFFSVIFILLLAINIIPQSYKANAEIPRDSSMKKSSRMSKELDISNQLHKQKEYYKTLVKDTLLAYNVIKAPNLIYPNQKIKTDITYGVKKAIRDTVKETSVKKTETENAKNNLVLTHNAVDPENLGIGDLVIDRTQSVWGRDFVDLFNKYWNPPQNIGDYTIIIEEKPLPRLGTIILIKVNGNYVYKRFIQPRYYNIRMNAEQGAQLTLSYVEHYRQIQRSLEGDDMKGTGIY